MTTADVRSLAALFLHRVASTPDRDAFLFPRGEGWARCTWSEAGAKVRAIACGLRSLGVALEERCAIVASTRVEWILADFGIMCAGGATTTIYPSNTAEECAYIINDSRSVVAFVEDQEQLEKLEHYQHELMHLRAVIVMDSSRPLRPGVMTLDQLMAAGEAWDRGNDGAYEGRIAEIGREHLATLLYTSGTTGRQKGVELLHDCWLYEAEAIDSLGLLVADDLQYLWLPLSHSFGKVLESAQVRIGFVSAIDGRVDKLVDNLAQIKPTFVAAVPRVFEKVFGKVVIGAQERGGLALKIFTWAFRVGRRVSEARQKGRDVGRWLAVQYHLADALVFSKLRARFGGRLRFFISGSAPLSREVAEFFHAANVLVLEGYGLTESSAATCVNRPECFRFGTVGLPLPGTEIAIAPEDGEVLIRGRGVMRGYHKLANATADTLGPDGWLRTGDIGALDADGFLRITDRKKDLIKTSGGKYVAPQAIEGRLKAECPYINQALVFGNNRPYCSALFTLDEASVRRWLNDQSGQAPGLEHLVRHPRVVSLIQGHVDRVNASLASYETVKRFAILPADLSVDAGELTASLKVRRRTVEQKYGDLLDGLYDSGSGSPPRR